MIYGNEAAKKEVLKTCISKIMLSGPKGVGKFSIATMKAKQLLCLDQNDDDCQCYSCKRITTHCHPDLVIISSESAIKKEQIIGLNKHDLEWPTISKVRVIIIDNVDLMTTAAQNSFLKTLEEAAPYNQYILINQGSVLDTIRSRVCEIRFSRIGPNEFNSILIKKYPDSDVFDKQVLFYVTQGAIGRAFTFIESGKYEIFKRTMKAFIENYASDDRNLFRVFNLVKEKSEDNFFEQIEGFWKEFLILMILIFMDYERIRTLNMKPQIDYCANHHVHIKSDHLLEIFQELRNMITFENTLSINSFFQCIHKLDYLE